jgi:hypothetical protein
VTFMIGFIFGLSVFPVLILVLHIVLGLYAKDAKRNGVFNAG